MEYLAQHLGRLGSFQYVSFLISFNLPSANVCLSQSGVAIHLLRGGAMINFHNCGYSYSVSQRLLSCRKETKNCHSTGVNLPLGMLHSISRNGHCPVHWMGIDFWACQGVLHVGPFLVTRCFLLGQSPGGGEGKEQQL